MSLCLSVTLENACKITDMDGGMQKYASSEIILTTSFLHGIDETGAEYQICKMSQVNYTNHGLYLVLFY